MLVGLYSLLRTQTHSVQNVRLAHISATTALYAAQMEAILTLIHHLITISVAHHVCHISLFLDSSSLYNRYGRVLINETADPSCGSSIVPGRFTCADPSWILWTNGFHGPETACCMQGYYARFSRYCVKGPSDSIGQQYSTVSANFQCTFENGFIYAS